jgi:hypothetical protein
LIIPFPATVSQYLHDFIETIPQWLTKQSPCPGLDEISFGKGSFVLEYILQVLWVIDYHAGGQSRNRYLECLETKVPLTFYEPREEFLTWLQEDEAISNEWQPVQRSP